MEKEQALSLRNEFSNIMGVGSEETLLDLVKSKGFLPRVQLMGSNSAQVQEGKIPQAHWALFMSSDHFIDLGESVDILPIVWRPKALQILGDNIIAVYNKEHPEFVRICEESTVKDSGCMYGPEYLIWIAQRKEYATLFMNSATARREAPNVAALLMQPATLKSRLIKTAKFRWHGPVVTSCSAPMDFPTKEEIQEQVQKFKEEMEKEPDITAVSSEDAAETRER